MDTVRCGGIPLEIPTDIRSRIHKKHPRDPEVQKVRTRERSRYPAKAKQFAKSCQYWSPFPGIEGYWGGPTRTTL